MAVYVITDEQVEAALALKALHGDHPKIAPCECGGTVSEYFDAPKCPGCGLRTAFAGDWALEVAYWNIGIRHPKGTRYTYEGDR